MVNSRSLKILTSTELSKMKNRYVNSNIICPILQITLDKDSAVVDHKHITKSDVKKRKTGEDGKGLLRGVIHNQANVFIGKIEKGFARSGCHKFDLSISDQLRNIADYIESPPLPQIYIHPNERIKIDKLTKTDYSRIIKYWFQMFPKARTVPAYPKNGIRREKQKDGTIKEIYKAKKTPKWITWLNMANECALPKKRRKVERIR